MRSYPRNSPEAAARTLALVLIADGHVCRSEMEIMNQRVPGELGLDPDAFARILQKLCEDLLLADPAGGLTSALECGTLDALADEIDDPVLQGKVLLLARAAAHSDSHLAERETKVLEAIRRRWEYSRCATAGRASTASTPTTAPR